MIKNIKKKFIAVLLLILTILSNIIPIIPSISFAANNNCLGTTMNIVSIGSVPYHLKSHGVSSGGYVITHLAGYYDNGTFYPAYCMQRDLAGAGDDLSYDVTITDILGNSDTYNKVWRVVTAGYPYNSPESLGVPDWTYAYQATKMAVYCVMGQANVNDYYATDSIGQSIVDLINRLVSIGENGSNTYKTPLSNISKSGNITLDGNYYIQNYTLNSNIDIVSYDIATTGFPNGTKITGTDGTEKSTFGFGEVFQVRIPKNSYETGDINGRIRASINSKSYAVFYASSYNSELQDYTVTGDPIALTSCSTELNTKANTGKIKIIKQDVDTKMPIEGVTFQLSKKDGTIISNATTDANGEARFSNLYQNDYVLKEISTNDNYVLNKLSFDVSVKYNQTTTKTITNEHKKGDLTIHKIDADNKNVVLGNVEFQLYSEEFNKIVGTYYTDVNGEIKIENLRTGNYKLIETKTNKWYNLAPNTEIEIKWDEETTKSIENELKKGQIKVIKIDQDNNEVRLEGVEFEVLDENDNVLERIITNENGEALTSKYPLRDFSKLKIRESKTLENYVLSDEVKTITLKENQIETVTFENEKKKGQIKVIKVDFDNKEVKIPDVEFKVYDEVGNVVETLVTDVNGEATSKRLPIDQDYTVQETKTGKWYVLNSESQTVTLKQDEIKNMTFTNEKKKGQIRIIKVDKDDNEVLLEGVKFEIKNEDGKIVDTLITNKDGEAVSKRLPIDQKYTVYETETKQEYVLTEETQTITLEQDQIKDLTFENEMIKGYLQITKVDSKTKEKLEGAKFGIYDNDDNLVEEISTNSDGIATSNLILYGKYYVKELDTGSPYYLLNENTYEFEIVKNHEIVPVTIENDGVEIDVDVDKEGTTEIKPGEQVNYKFSNICNNSNVYLENFKWYDYIPTDYIRLQTMTTGTWNQDLNYSVYYKTNKSEEYILFKENLNTKENYDLDFTELNLQDDEYIIETYFDFGKVDVGFKEEINPTMQCKALETLENNQTFTNKTKTVGVYYGITAESDSKWTTIVHVPEEKHEEILPKTGK